jgi:hypothetical protein
MEEMILDAEVIDDLNSGPAFFHKSKKKEPRCCMTLLLSVSG